MQYPPSRWVYGDYVRLDVTEQLAVKCCENPTDWPWILVGDLNDFSKIGVFVTEDYIERNEPTLIGCLGAEG